MSGLRAFGFAVLLLAPMILPITSAGPSSSAAPVVREIVLSGKKVEYTATAAALPLKDAEGKPKADVFYVAYARAGERRTPESRPITFVFNGGPGSASFWLHLGIGPKRAPLDADGFAVAGRSEVEDNDQSWLDLTDLVFVDAIETGYSRARAGESLEQFVGFANDVRWTGEFIKQYLTEHRRWSSPVYLLGESYGGTRVAGLTEHLQLDNAALKIAGAMFMAPGLNYQTIWMAEDHELPYVLLLPSLTATAAYHGRLASDLMSDLDATLAEVERFAINEYAVALLKGFALSDEERSALAEKIARYTGLPAAEVLACNLRVDSPRFRASLLKDRELVTGHFDARYTRYNRNPPAGTGPADVDAFFSEVRGSFSSALRQYLVDDLGYATPLDYRLTAKLPPWNFEVNKYLNTASNLARAMTMNPAMKVWIASGYYDLHCPYFAARYQVDHLNVPKSQRDAVAVTNYRAGHMMYLRKSELAQLKADAVRFYQGASSGRVP